MTNLSTREGYLGVMDDLAAKARTSLYGNHHPGWRAVLSLSSDELHVLLDVLQYFAIDAAAGEEGSLWHTTPWEDYA